MSWSSPQREWKRVIIREWKSSMSHTFSSCLALSMSSFSNTTLTPELAVTSQMSVTSVTSVTIFISGASVTSFSGIFRRRWHRWCLWIPRNRCFHIVVGVWTCGQVWGLCEGESCYIHDVHWACDVCAVCDFWEAGDFRHFGSFGLSPYSRGRWALPTDRTGCLVCMQGRRAVGSRLGHSPALLDAHILGIMYRESHKLQREKPADANIIWGLIGTVTRPFLL